MQPAHPGDASYARAAALLAEPRLRASRANTAAARRRRAGDGDLLVIAHPSEPRGSARPASARRSSRATRWTRSSASYAAAAAWSCSARPSRTSTATTSTSCSGASACGCADDTVQDYEHCDGAPTWILGELRTAARGSGGDLLAGVNAACFYRATTIESRNGARVLARTHRPRRSRRAVDRRVRARRRARGRARRTQTCSATTASATLDHARAVAEHRRLGGPAAR